MSDERHPVQQDIRYRQFSMIANDSTSEEECDQTLNTTEEECRGTIPGSAIATVMALAGQCTVSSPVVKRSKPRKVKKRTLQPKTDQAATQTDPLNSLSSLKKQ